MSPHQRPLFVPCYSIVQAKPRVAPPEELPDHRLINPPLTEEHLKDPVTEEMIQDIEFDLWKRNEPARCGRLTLDDIIAPRQYPSMIRSFRNPEEERGNGIGQPFFARPYGAARFCALRRIPGSG